MAHGYSGINPEPSDLKSEKLKAETVTIKRYEFGEFS